MSEEIRYPSLAEVSRLYDRITKSTGGESGYLSKSNLEYLLDAVRDIAETLPRKQAIAKKASFLLYNVIVVHPFLNGNKRTGYGLAELFLASNGYEILAEAEESYRFLLEVAMGKASEKAVEGWVARHLTELREK